MRDTFKESNSSADGQINLIHYDEAAACVMTALEKAKDLKDIDSKLFLVSELEPISRMSICETAKGNPTYKDSSIPKFNDVAAADGKCYDTEKVRSTLEWTNKFNFKDFMASQYGEEMQIPDLS